MLYPRLFLRPDLCRSIPTPEAALNAANRKAQQLSAKAQRDMEADGARRQNAAVRADDHARADADRRFATKQRTDAGRLEALRRAINEDEDDSSAGRVSSCDCDA